MMFTQPQTTFAQLRDKLLGQCDQMLRTLVDGVDGSSRQSPASMSQQQQSDAALSYQDKCHIAGLMRVNHTGEVMAQALYHGQMMWVDKDDPLHIYLSQAAIEEADHLAWCKQRIDQLAGRPSLLTPVWYLGSFTLGAVAGACGREYSLGFIAEVEHKVHVHLQSHLDQLPPQDIATKALLKQMQQDENEHRKRAILSGGKPLPEMVNLGLNALSGIMTSVAYRV